MQALETSIANDGWIGAITVAADGETFDGSARVEKTAENGMLDEALVIDIDGTRPVVLRRTDIPSANDPRAVRLGVAANRVAELNLSFDPNVMAGLAEEGVLDGLYVGRELENLLVSLPLNLDVDGIDSDDTEPQAYAGGDLPPSYVRMVQLFFTSETQPEFLRVVQAIMPRLGQTNLTDTVFEAVKHAYRTLDVPDAD